MKKIPTALAFVAASLLSTAAMAQGYVSASVGSGHRSINCDFNPTCDSSGTAFKVLGGYGFGNGFAGELGYISFGKAKYTDPILDLEFETSGYLLGVAYHAEVAKDFGLTARVGVASIKTKLKGTGFGGIFSWSSSETNTKPYFGVAATYAINKTVKAEVAADFTRTGFPSDHQKVHAITAGVRFDF